MIMVARATQPRQAAPLWQILHPVTDIVAGVLVGHSYATAIERVEPVLRAGAQALTWTVLRNLGRIQALGKALTIKAPPPLVEALLYSALALLWEGSMYPAHTVVDQCVRCARSRRVTQHHAAFLNACLRHFLRRREALCVQIDKVETAVWNHPQWWIDLLRQDWPTHWQTLLHAAVQPAPIVLRRNVRRVTQAELLESLHRHGIDAKPVGEDAVMLGVSHPVDRLPGFSQGWFVVQDLAAQCAVPLLLSGGFRPMRVLDACAAPGGKTTHLLERLDTEVTALDRDPQRCMRIRENLDRLRLDAKVLCADACDTAAWWNRQHYDAIILDAPCTGSGVVRRHPDIPWLKRLEDVRALSHLQARMLDALWPLLRPGGRLLYATCSLFRSEGCERVEAFVAMHPDATALPAPGHLLPGSSSLTQAGELNHDGFFYALLHKSDSATAAME